MLEEMGVKAKAAAASLASATTQLKNMALVEIATKLVENTDSIIKANEIDIENGKAAGLSDGLIDRLMLNAEQQLLTKKETP